MSKMSMFIGEVVKRDGGIDEVATIIGESINAQFIEGFMDFIDNPDKSNALYMSKKLKILFEDYVSKHSLTQEVGL